MGYDPSHPPPPVRCISFFCSISHMSGGRSWGIHRQRRPHPPTHDTCSNPPPRPPVAMMPLDRQAEAKHAPCCCCCCCAA